MSDTGEDTRWQDVQRQMQEIKDLILPPAQPAADPPAPPAPTPPEPGAPMPGSQFVADVPALEEIRGLAQKLDELPARIVEAMRTPAGPAQDPPPTAPDPEDPPSPEKRSRLKRFLLG